MYCKNCGKELSDGAQFCPNCGLRVNDTVGNQPVAQAAAQIKKAEKAVKIKVAGPAEKYTKKVMIIMVISVIAFILLYFLTDILIEYMYGIQEYVFVLLRPLPEILSVLVSAVLSNKMLKSLFERENISAAYGSMVVPIFLTSAYLLLNILAEIIRTFLFEYYGYIFILNPYIICAIVAVVALIISYAAVKKYSKKHIIRGE